MNLHVILGPPGAGKAGRAVAKLREAAASGTDAFLCVPGAVDRARFLRELAGTEGTVTLGVEVGTFDQLIDRIAGSLPVRRTDRAMERIVVRDALQRVPAFADAMRWSGFVDSARVHVDQLRRARIWGGAELERVEQQLPGLGVDAWRMLEQQVAALLNERRLRDDAWFEQRAAQALRAGRPGVGAVVVYGFDHLAPGHIELVERLSAHVPVTVTLAWRPGRRVHERAADLRDRWRSRGAFLEELDAPAQDGSVLGWLGSELFEDAPAPPPAPMLTLDTPAPVAFVDCCGVLQEAEEVVREVALLAGNGYEWDDIAVASARADDHAAVLVAAFERAGVPVRLQSRRTAIDVAAGRALHALLAAAIDADALALVAALRSPIFTISRARLDRLELQLRRSRHRGSTLLKDPVLVRTIGSEVADVLAAAQTPSAGDLQLRAFRALLASLRPNDLGELDLLRGIAALTEGLIVAAGGAEGVALRDIRDAIESFPLTVPDRSDSGSVVIASIEDLRSVAYDAVVLRGMHVAGFRAAVDDEADAPTAARDLLHLAVTRARQTLRVVRQVAGADGGPLAPSTAWQELRRLQPDAPLRVRRLSEVVIAPDQVRLTSEIPASIARATADGQPVEGVSADELDVLRAHRRTRRAPRVEGPVAAELEAIRQLGVTSVERYATCSAKWFIEQWLELGDVDEDRTRIVDGQLAHELLRVLVPELHERGDVLDAASMLARAMELVPELVAAVDTNGVLDGARVERIVQDVLLVLEGERAWQRPDVVDVERSFGSDAEDSIGAGLVVDGVELTGRVDRIDRYGSHVVLHDYKYSATPRPAKDLIEDRNLQLLVYWLALQQPGTALEPIGAIYRSVTKAGAPSGVYTEQLREHGIIGSRIKAGVLDADQQEELLAAAREIVGASVEGIRRGRVEPLEDPAQCPSHCRLQPICRVGEGAA